jgi:hypothetical protein
MLLKEVRWGRKKFENAEFGDEVTCSRKVVGRSADSFPSNFRNLWIAATDPVDDGTVMLIEHTRDVGGLTELTSLATKLEETRLGPPLPLRVADSVLRCTADIAIL